MNFARTLAFTLNGRALSGADGSIASPSMRLLDLLRLQAGQTGTKEGCGEGECGACAVLVDGEVVNSCLVPVGQLHGRTVTSIEGLAGNLCRCTGYARIYAAVLDAATVRGGDE